MKINDVVYKEGKNYKGWWVIGPLNNEQFYADLITVIVEEGYVLTGFGFLKDDPLEGFKRVGTIDDYPEFLL